MPMCDDREERGVYFAKHTDAGRRILYAVDSHGDLVKPRVLIRADASPLSLKASVNYLWNRLDIVDPQPRRRRLQLVVDTPEPIEPIAATG